MSDVAMSCDPPSEFKAPAGYLDKLKDGKSKWCFEVYFDTGLDLESFTSIIKTSSNKALRDASCQQVDNERLYLAANGSVRMDTLVETLQSKAARKLFVIRDIIYAELGNRAGFIESRNAHGRVNIEDALTLEKEKTAKLVRENTRLTNEALEANQRADELQNRIRELEVYKDMHAMVDRMRTETDRLAGNNNIFANNNDKLVNEIAKLTAETDRLKAENDRLATETDRLTAENDRLASEHDDIKARLNTMYESIDNLQNDNQDKTSTANTAIKRFNNNRSKLARVTTILKKMKKALKTNHPPATKVAFMKGFLQQGLQTTTVMNIDAMELVLAMNPDILQDEGGV